MRVRAWLMLGLAFGAGAVTVLGLVAFYGWGGRPAAAPPPPPAAMADAGAAAIERARAAAITIQVFAGPATAATARGSGFVLAPEGWVVTALHVLRGAGRVAVADSQGQQWAVAGVAAADRGSDLVLLTLAGAPPAARLALGESTGLRPGGAVTVIGSPLGLAGSVLNGSLAARRPVAGSGEWLQLTAPLAEGASGAPVLAADGTVAGVASLAANGLAGVGFAVPAEAVAALRERAAAGAAMPFPEWARRQARVLAWQGITADAAWREAQRLLQAGERAAAFRQLEQLAQRDPENPLLLVQLARLTAAAGRPELALPFLAKAAALDGEDPWVHLELARTARATGQVPPMEILGHLRQAVAAAPGHALAWLDLGVALEEAGDRQGAAAAYRRAAALAPGLTAAQEARNRLSAGSGARP